MENSRIRYLLNEGKDSRVCCLHSTSQHCYLLWEAPWANYIFFFFFLRHLWHMEFPWLGVKSELQLLAHATPHQIWAPSTNYVAAFSNAWSLNHWARPGIKPASSRTLYQVLNPLSHKGNSLIELFNSLCLSFLFCGMGPI